MKAVRSLSWLFFVTHQPNILPVIHLISAKAMEAPHWGSYVRELALPSNNNYPAIKIIMCSLNPCCNIRVSTCTHVGDHTYILATPIVKEREQKREERKRRERRNPNILYPPRTTIVVVFSSSAFMRMPYTSITPHGSLEGTCAECWGPLELSKEWRPLPPSLAHLLVSENWEVEELVVWTFRTLPNYCSGREERARER